MHGIYREKLLLYNITRRLLSARRRCHAILAVHAAMPLSRRSYCLMDVTLILFSILMNAPPIDFCSRYTSF